MHYIVYTDIMKNITFSAAEETIEEARKVASRRHSTLNEMFREWLEGISKEHPRDEDTADKLDTLWKQTGYLRVGKKLTRDEMNER